MNLPYILKTLKTTKLSELVANIDAPPIDINIALWDAVKNGSIELNEAKDKVKLLVEVETPKNMTIEEIEMRQKVLRVIDEFGKREALPTRGRLIGYIKDPVTQQGYKTHDLIVAVQSLLDEGLIVEKILSVPAIKDVRPFNRFVFYGFPDNQQMDEWAEKAIAKWLAQFDKKK